MPDGSFYDQLVELAEALETTNTSPEIGIVKTRIVNALGVMGVGGIDENGVEILVNGTILPSGTTWTEFLDAYNAATAGDLIVLPGELITQTSGWFINKAIKVIGNGEVDGNGHPLSGFKILGDITLAGSSQQIAIGYGGFPTTPYTTVEGVEIAYLTIEHTRNATNRCNAISFFGHTKDIHVHHCYFKNITSDVFIFRNESTMAIEGQIGALEDILIHDNIVEEWYETVFNWHEGSGSRICMWNNYCTCMAGGHPNFAVSRPYAALCNIEEDIYDGFLDGFHLINNTFISDLYNWSLGVGGQAGSGTDFNDSVGFAMRRNNNPDIRYHHVSLRGNFFKGWDKILYHIQTQTVDGSPLFPGPAYVDYSGNRFEEFGDVGVNIDDWGAAGDVIIFGDNDIVVLTGEQTGILLPGGAGVVSIIQQPPNRVVGP